MTFLFFLISFFYIFVVRLFVNVPLFLFASIPLGLYVGLKYRRHLWPETFYLESLGGMALGFLGAALFLFLNGSQESYIIIFWAFRLLCVLFLFLFFTSFKSVLIKMDMMKVLITCFTAQALISWVAYFVTPFRLWLLQEQFFGNLASLTIPYIDFNTRLFGLGQVFFGEACFFGFFLLLLLSQAKRISSGLFYLYFSILFGTAISTARIAYIMVPIGGLLLLIQKKYKDFVKFGLSILGVILLLMSLQSFTIAHWAVEPFLNLINKGKFQTNSSVTLNETITKALNDHKSETVTPNQITGETPLQNGSKFFGDGKFLGDGGYYKYTDVGLLRLYFFGGPLYVLFFFLPSFLLCWQIFRRKDSELRSYIWYLFIFQVACNLKGLIEFSPLFLFLNFYECARLNYKNEKGSSAKEGTI